jgi:hypothetical protein
MQEKKNSEPKPGRMEVLRDLPSEIMKSLSKKEIQAFLFEDVWPDSLQKKMKDYLE